MDQKYRNMSWIAEFEQEQDQFNQQYRNHPEFRNPAGILPHQLQKIREKYGANAFRRWYMGEEQELVRLVNAHVDIRAIASELKRSVGAIAARIEKLHNSYDHRGNALLDAVPICYQCHLDFSKIRKWETPSQPTCTIFCQAAQEENMVLPDFRHLNPHLTCIQIQDQITVVVWRRLYGEYAVDLNVATMHPTHLTIVRFALLDY